MARDRRRGRSGGYFVRWFRRMRRMAMLGAVGGVAYAWWRDRSTGPASSGPGDAGGGAGGGGTRPRVGGPRSPSALHVVAESSPQEPRLASVHPFASAATTDEHDAAAAASEVWVDPLDGGACPASHPVKVNDKSGIYHMPGGRFYDRTAAERCYVTAEAAESDGYRRAKT